MERTRKYIECAFGILKKRFLFSKTPIEMHAREKVEADFCTCAAQHDWMCDYDGWYNWEGVSGLLMKEDFMVECDPMYESNRSFSATSKYYGFTRHFTRSEERRLNAVSYSYDGDCD